VESDGRKCAFLRAAVRELEVPVRIHNIRAEALNRAKIDEIEVVTARAFSSMANILRLSSLFVAKGAVAVLPRSESSIAEVEELDSTRYMVHIDAKRSDARGVIIRIQERRRGT
jgi:16S rRNA (guanine527-N7)-methyltransferase